MKMFAYILLTVVMVSIFCQPLFEVFLVYKDRIVLSAAITNSCRAAKRLSVDYLSQRDMDAVVKQDVFTRNFIDTFEKALNLRCVDNIGNEIEFESSDDSYNDFLVNIAFYEEYSGVYQGSINTKVTIEVESVYKFKTKLLRESEAVINSNSGDVFKLASKVNYNIIVQN